MVFRPGSAMKTNLMKIAAFLTAQVEKSLPRIMMETGLNHSIPRLPLIGCHGQGDACGGRGGLMARSGQKNQRDSSLFESPWKRRTEDAEGKLQLLNPTQPDSSVQCGFGYNAVMKSGMDGSEQKRTNGIFCHHLGVPGKRGTNPGD